MDSSGDKLNDLLKAFDKYEESKRSSEDNQESVLTAKQALLDAYRSHSSSVTSQEKYSNPDDGDFEAALKFCEEQVSARQKDASKIAFSTKTTSLFKPVAFPSTSEENLKAVREVRELSIEEKTPASPQSSTDEIKIASFTPPTVKPSKGQITIVESDGRKYTRIGPPSVDKLRTFAPSPDSAFRPALQLDGKRLRLDPDLQRLQDLNKSKLTRSTSVPASYPGSAEVNPALHRMLYRTGSFVSDLTKQKLKNSILARTSAALVRKPSITDQEMMQIRNSEGSDDSDSSMSGSEDESTKEQSGSRKRKYSDEIVAITNSALRPQLLPVVITTTGPT